WDEEIVRGSLDDGSFTIWYLHGGVVKAALTFGRSGDLDHARRLVLDGRPLGDQRAALADLEADLAEVGVDRDFRRAERWRQVRTGAAPRWSRARASSSIQHVHTVRGGGKAVR